MAERIILVGRAPSRTSDPARPLAGSQSGRRLLSLSGLQGGQFWRAFEAVNLLDRWPGPAAGAGDRFPLAEARLAARELRRHLEGRRVLLLGPEVCTALGAEPPPLLVWRPGVPAVPASSWAVFPHPSGVSHFWNSAADALDAARFLQDAAREVLGRDPEPWEGATPGLGLLDA